MNAKISTTVAKQLPTTKDANYLAKRNGVSPKACDQVTNLYAVTPNRDGSMVWDFEDATAGYAPFTVDDKDGDGYNWTYYNNTGLETGRMTAHGGEGLIASASYDNDSGTALNPNNWLISPEVTLGGSLKFWAAGQDAGYAAEKFGVYVTIDGTNYTQVGADKTATGEYVEYEYDLTPYAGQTGKFAIVHHNVTDMFFLNVDDITFDPSSEVTPEPTIPTNVAVVPTATTGEVTWVPGENNASWNLRWRPYVDPASVSTLWDLPIENGSVPQAADFSIYDADGDGNNWGLAATDQASTDAAFYSASYSGGALSPDNWLFTPEIGLGGTLKFDAWQYSASWPDKFMVYVAPADYASLDEFVPVSEFIIPTGTTPESFEIDLSEYEGMGVIAFRHYDCTDQFRIYLDNIEVIPADAVEIPDWTVVENVENPYTIEGLTPETEYEVQVMAFNETGDKYTDWTESTRFTTLAETVEPNEGFFLVGTFNGWSQETGMLEFVDNKVEGVELEAEAEFKVITYDVNNNTVWFGGEDANGVGYFLINNDMLNINITLVDGSNFRIAEAGTYNFELVQEGKAAPMLKVTKEEGTGISTVGVDAKADNAYYNLLGVKFNGMPTTPGIYIHNGKKVIIK